MTAIIFGMNGIEHWLATFGTSEAAKLALARAGIAGPYVVAALIGIVFLFACAGSTSIQSAGCGVLAGSVTLAAIAAGREAMRLIALSGKVPDGQSVLSLADPPTMIGAGAAAIAACFALRVVILGNGAFPKAEPKRIRGKRALHGEAEWMKMP
ncbi:MAG: Ti-type conjugative transfer system protein TraG, partial [Ensifer adhaerens]